MSESNCQTCKHHRSISRTLDQRRDGAYVSIPVGGISEIELGAFLDSSAVGTDQFEFLKALVHGATLECGAFPPNDRNQFSLVKPNDICGYYEKASAT